MQLQTNNNFNGAMVNTGQLELLYQMFRIHPWSYLDENPFELLEKLKEQERALGELGLS